MYIELYMSCDDVYNLYMNVTIEYLVYGMRWQFKLVIRKINIAERPH